MKRNVLLRFTDDTARPLQLDEATRSATMKKLKVRPARLHPHALGARPGRRRGIGKAVPHMCPAPVGRTPAVENADDRSVKIDLFRRRQPGPALTTGFE